MKSLVLKECRENLKWAVLAMFFFGGIIGQTLDNWQNVRLQVFLFYKTCQLKKI